MKISQEEYDEYIKLKDWAKKEKVYQSIDAISNLREDVDLPIRKCVAMLALLGCKPIFSCCGFDYRGQPFHKSHQLGRPYIKLTDNIRTTTLQLEISDNVYRAGWQFRNMGGEIVLEFISLMNPSWRDTSCIHNSEEIVIGIRFLEKVLEGLSSKFADVVVLEDTNRGHRSLLRFWQYPPKNNWMIRKSDLGEL